MAEVLLEESEVRALLAKALRSEIEKVGYDSPIRKIVNEVVAQHENDLRATMLSALRDITNDQEFQAILRQEAKHKIAKQMVGELTSNMGKALAALKADPRIKADMVKAIEKIIDSDN